MLYNLVPILSLNGGESLVTTWCTGGVLTKKTRSAYLCPHTMAQMHVAMIVTRTDQTPFDVHFFVRKAPPFEFP